MGIMVATIEIAPESMSTAQRFSEPSGVTVLYGYYGEKQKITYTEKLKKKKKKNGKGRRKIIFLLRFQKDKFSGFSV